MSRLRAMVELLVIGVTLLLAGIAAGTQSHRRAVASRTFDEYARSRALAFVPAPSAPSGASPRIVGETHGVPFAIDLYKAHGEIRTRIRASTRTVGTGVPLSVIQRRRRFTMRSEVSAFERAYQIESGRPEDEELLRSVVAPSLLFLDRRPDVWLASDGTGVTLSWTGIETCPLTLDAAREAVIAVAGRHAPETPYR